MQQVPQTEIPSRREEIQNLFIDFNISQKKMSSRLNIPHSTFKARLDGRRIMTKENEENILAEIRKMITAAESCFRTSLERQQLREKSEKSEL